MPTAVVRLSTLSTYTSGSAYAPKTIYVRQDDMRVWQRAGAYAKERRLSMSALIMTALEAYLEAEEGSR